MAEPICFQRARAAIALTITIGAIQKYGASDDPQTTKLVNAIGKTVFQCCESAAAKHLSRGAMRDHAAACDMAAPWLEDYHKLHDDIIFFRWGAVCYCALTLIEDARNICPAICVNSYKKKWQTLRGLAGALRDALMEEEPGIASSGCCLYECVEDAMRGEKEIIPICNMSYAFTRH